MKFKYWLMTFWVFFLCFQIVDSQTTNNSCASNHYASAGGCIKCGNCVSLPCGATRGQCGGGCKAGFRGKRCDIECEKGRYGTGCQNRCSTTCLDNDCNSVNGTCNDCEIGYSGETCDQECSPGTYGWRCENSCAGCLNNDCDPKTGHCMRCPNGYIGEKCTIECPDSTYGENCTHSCPHCSGLQCNKTTGQCLTGCSSGYHGDKCEMDHLSFKHGLMYGSLPLAILLILVVFLIFFLFRRQKQRRNSEQSVLNLQRIQRRIDGYTTYPLREMKGDKSDDKSVDLSPPESPPESPSPPEKRRQFGSFLSKNVSKVKSKKVRPEPEGSQLQDTDAMDGRQSDCRQSGYISVLAKPEVMSDDGYLVVNHPHVTEEDYVNMSDIQIEPTLTVSEEIYENTGSTQSIIESQKTRIDSQPLYENFSPGSS